MNDICSKMKLKISFYIDGELQAEDKQNLEQHLEACPQCREYLHELQQTSNIISEALSSRPEINFDKVLQNIKSEIQAPTQPSLLQRISDWVKMPRIWVPATAMMCTAALILSFNLLVFESPEGIQISRVESVSSQSGQVMVLKTAQTQQPLIWFTEAQTKETQS